MTPKPMVSVVTHPLDPLTADEIEIATEVVRSRQDLGPSALFVEVALREPSKEVVLGHREGAPVDRQADLVVHDRASGKNYEAVIGLGARELRSWREVEGVQPLLTGEECRAMNQLVRSDPRWQAAMRRRGVTDFDLAMIDAWPLGYDGPRDGAAQGRFALPLTWVHQHPDDNAYARPVEGLLVRVDLDRMEVVEVEDHGVVPLPPRSGNYAAGQIADPNNVPHFPAGVRQDVRPVEITQPEGPSFTVDGNLVRWQKWEFRVGFTPREGLVLHTVGYRDGERLRPVLYRGSVAEMFVPYGDPAPVHRRKNVFDMGEYGIGRSTNSLELGCDCLGEIRYFDGWLNDGEGHAQRLANAVCLHEEDDGILWKHTERSGVEVRRSRRLVVSSIATFGNYEYGYFWYLHQDGSIHFEIKLTGIMSTGAVPEGEEPAHGVVVAPGLYGPHHQHIFSVRLDMMVDGPRNTVYECDAEAVPRGPQNPHGNAWVVRSLPLRRESEGQRVADAGRARYWKIVSSEQRNGVGGPTAYRLVPQAAALPFFAPDAHPIRRAGFATRHLWVTAFDPRERFAAGEYPNQSAGGEGLPSWVRADRPLEDADLVLWHTLVVTHEVRPEEWPVMACSRTGFALQPVGFFDGNPALDVPPPAPSCEHG